MGVDLVSTVVKEQVGSLLSSFYQEWSQNILLTNMKTKNCDNGSKIWRREIVDGADYLKKSI